MTTTSFLTTGCPLQPCSPISSSSNPYLSFKVQLKFYFLHDCSLEPCSLKCILLPPSSPCRNLHLSAYVLPLKPFVNGSVLSSSVRSDRGSHIHTGSSSGTCTREVPKKNICYVNDKELKVLLCPPNLGLMFDLQQKVGGRRD